MVVGDDGSVTYSYERLDIGLRPMPDEALNRQFPLHSQQGPVSTNPYTYGDWRPLGESFTPPKYTVFLLEITNYAYPKVRVDPDAIELASATSSYRRYAALKLPELLEYYYAHIQGYAGNAFLRFKERQDILVRTLYSGEMLFSGQETSRFVVFPKLPPDVVEFTVHLRRIALRFNYRDEPVEEMGLAFHFRREVYKGYQPPPSLSAQDR